MDKTQITSFSLYSVGNVFVGGCLLVLIMFTAEVFADLQYARDGYGYGQQHGSRYRDNAFGSYKYPRGSVAPGASLNNGHRPGDGLNANRYGNNRRDYPTYRNHRRQDNSNRRFSSNSPPGYQGEVGPLGNRNGSYGQSKHRDRNYRGDADYRDGYSRGFERGYSRGRRDSRFESGDGRIYRQNPYGQNPNYLERRSFGGQPQRGYNSPYQRY